MSANYYYLVAGLPDLLLDEGRQPLTCGDFILEASEQLNKNDFSLFKLLQLPFDNENLIALLLKKERPFSPLGSIDEEELTDGLKNPDTLPVYMETFIESFHENRSQAPGLIPADQLAWFFYDEMTRHREPFIAEWYCFDLNLRNVIAGINCRREFAHLEELATEREKAAASTVIGRDDVADAIIRSNAPDFGLTMQLPWIERVVALSRESIQEFEKGVDTLRWDVLNEMTITSHFRAETVFAFFIKLAMVERWQALDPKTGQEQLERLVDELTASYAVPADF